MSLKSIQNKNADYQSNVFLFIAIRKKMILFNNLSVEDCYYCNGKIEYH